MPRVSLCIIAKNEEHRLGKCLGSVADLVHERGTELRRDRVVSVAHQAHEFLDRCRVLSVDAGFERLDETLGEPLASARFPIGGERERTEMSRRWGSPLQLADRPDQCSNLIEQRIPVVKSP